MTDALACPRDRARARPRRPSAPSRRLPARRAALHGAPPPSAQAVEGGKGQLFTLTFGGPSDFVGGLQRLVGEPMGHRMLGMREEHCNGPDSKTDFEASDRSTSIAPWRQHQTSTSTSAFPHRHTHCTRAGRTAPLQPTLHPAR